ncbi:MAG: hypothetical protein QM731_13485 [Chitinophagaceae bacterium]
MKPLIFLFLCIALCTGCSKSDHHIQEATYTGTFQRTGSLAAGPAVNVTLTLKEGKFNGGKTDTDGYSKYPSICEGNYSITQDSIRFENTCAFTAEFDWTLILSGTYTFQLQHDSLVIWRGNAQSTDIYKLAKKQ